MSTTKEIKAKPVDVKLEVEIIPVSDVDRSKKFYESLGWRLDDDVAPLDGLRIVQFTPPGSGSSVTFGKGLRAVGGLVVSDIEAAHDEFVSRGIDVSDVWHGPPFPAEARLSGPDPKRTSYGSFVQRSRRQYMDSPGSHDTAPRQDLTSLTQNILCKAIP